MPITSKLLLDLKQTSSYHLRDAFKTNAWMQISHLTPEQAKEQYIELINILNEKKYNYEKSCF
jgi:acyl-CoA-binding protein